MITNKFNGVIIMIKKILAYVKYHFGYLPHARRKWATCGALTVVGTPSTVTRGILVAETGINVRRFQVRYHAEINAPLEGITGEITARGISQLFSREITCEGEISGTTGIMAFALATACTFANSVTDFGGVATVGKILMEEATVTSERAGWRSVSVRCVSNPLLT